RKTVAERVVQPVDLVGEDVLLVAEDIGIVQSCAGKCPMLRAIDRKASLAVRRESAPGCVEAMRAVHAHRRGAGPTDVAIFPGRSHQAPAVRADDRVLVDGFELVADLALA